MSNRAAAGRSREGHDLQFCILIGALSVVFQVTLTSLQFTDWGRFTECHDVGTSPAYRVLPSPSHRYFVADNYPLGHEVTYLMIAAYAPKLGIACTELDTHCKIGSWSYRKSDSGCGKVTAWPGRPGGQFSQQR